jgi:hypothetical protein
MWHYSSTEGAVGQRIRDWARRLDLRALRRKGMWYFVNENNVLESWEHGLDDSEALEWLTNSLEDEKGGAQ